LLATTYPPEAGLKADHGRPLTDVSLYHRGAHAERPDVFSTGDHLFLAGVGASRSIIRAAETIPGCSFVGPGDGGKGRAAGKDQQSERRMNESSDDDVEGRPWCVANREKHGPGQRLSKRVKLAHRLAGDGVKRLFVPRKHGVKQRSGELMLEPETSSHQQPGADPIERRKRPQTSKKDGG